VVGPHIGLASLTGVDVGSPQLRQLKLTLRLAYIFKQSFLPSCFALRLEHLQTDGVLVLVQLVGQAVLVGDQTGIQIDSRDSFLLQHAYVVQSRARNRRQRSHAVLIQALCSQPIPLQLLCHFLARLRRLHF